MSQAPDATFTDDISEFIDPHAILTHYAVEVATAEVDGLTSFFGVNNFYLYQREGSPRFLFIPWDHDFNFTSSSHSISFGADRNRLVQRLLADPELKALYRTTLQSIVEQFVNPDWMTPRIDSFLALITDAVLQDTKRRGGDNPQTSKQAFDDAVAHLRSVIAARGASVEAQLNASHRRAARH